MSKKSSSEKEIEFENNLSNGDKKDFDCIKPDEINVEVVRKVSNIYVEPNQKGNNTNTISIEKRTE